MGHRGKTQAAVFLGDDHSQETITFYEVPGCGVQVCIIMGNFPLVQHVAQLFYRAVDKILFFDGQFEIGLLFEQLPIGLAGK